MEPKGGLGLSGHTWMCTGWADTQKQRWFWWIEGRCPKMYGLNLEEEKNSTFISEYLLIPDTVLCDFI